MVAQTVTVNTSEQDLAPEQQLQKLRELYADAPQVGRVALENGLAAHGPKSAPLGVAGWLAVIALCTILGASIWFALYGWNLTDAVISRNGMISLVLGVVFSMALGGGLMALVFWSHKNGYDR